MSLFHLPQAYANLKRFQQIALTLAKHGFTHVLGRMRLPELIPGLKMSRMRAALQGDASAAHGPLTVPERLTRVMEELGATFIKFGQLLATRPDLVPEAYIQAFEALQDQVDPVPFERLRGVIESRLGKPVYELFARFDETPVASGSIGQVHYAELRDGTRVVVKIKRPDTDARVREDLDLLLMLAKMAEDHISEIRHLRPRMIVEEFARLMERELDFVGEASYTESFRNQFAENEWVTSPNVYWDYVSRDTLVVERMEGLRLTHEGSLQKMDRKKAAFHLGDCFMRQYFVNGFFHADPHPGNLFVREDGGIALIDFGQMGHISEELRQQLAMSLVALSNGDTDFIVDIYADIGVFSEETSLREFKGEFSTMMSRYYGMPVDRMDVGRAFQESIEVARRNGLQLPRDFVLLVKSVVTVMGVVRKIDPHFRIDKVLNPYLRHIFANQLNPLRMGKRLGFYLYRVYNILRRAPEDARDLLEKMRGGKMRIIFHHEGLENLSHQMERASNRLTVGMLISAILMGSSIVMAAGPETMGYLAIPYLGPTPLSILLSGVGFTIAMLLGFWLAWGILRSRRL